MKERGLATTYKSKPPSERSKNFEAFNEAKAWADSHTLTPRITVSDGGFPYKVVTDPTEAAEVIRSLHGKVYAYDYETTGLDVFQAKIAGLALADDRMSWYIARDGLRALPEFVELLKDWRSDPTVNNYKYEAKMNFTNLGIDPTDVRPAFDNQIAHWVWACGGQWTHSNGLKDTARRILGRTVLEFEDVVPGLKKKESNYGEDSPILLVQSSDEGLDLVARYAAAGDARNTYDLRPVLTGRLRAENLLHIYEDIERPLTPVLAEMELAGLDVDPERAKMMYVEYIVKQQELEAQLRTWWDGPLSSNRDLGKFLYGDLGLPVVAKTATGAPKVDATTLDKIQTLHPFIPVYMEWSKVEKLIGTFLRPYVENGVTSIHASINQTSTQTGRLSISGPNLQNLPLKVRDMIVPPPGQVIWGRDFNQIEPRLGSAASQDPGMLDDYRNGRDPYKQLGFDMGFDPEKVETKDPATRKIIKGAFLGWMYGARGPKLVETVAKQDVRITVQEANYYIQQLESNRPVFVRWRLDVIQKAKQAGASYSLYGRRRLLPKIWVKDPTMRAEAERESVNMVLQGTAADVIKMAMPKVLQLVKSAGGKLRNQVHDELVGTWSEEAEQELGPEVNKIMEYCELVPLKVEAAHGPTWYQAKP